jgi:hypothetical protein
VCREKALDTLTAASRVLLLVNAATFDVSPTWGAVQQIIAVSFDGARGLVAS